MAKMLSRVAPWSASRNETAPKFGTGPHGISVRILEGADTAQLRALALEDPVANVFILAQLGSQGSASPTAAGARIFGAFDGGTLSGACWAGANLVPVQLGPGLAPYMAEAVHRAGRRYASIFGPAETVLALHAALKTHGHLAHEVRREQPLMAINGEPDIPANPHLEFGDMADFERILPACAAMFEEEVGYSPFLGGEDFYSRRVAGLIRQGHSLVHIEDGRVLFKAELGAVTSEVSQVQGVWLNPDLRGEGLSAGYMAAVVQLARKFAPVTSLYVNHYNLRARSSYEKVGFEQVGTFATVLY